MELREILAEKVAAEVKYTKMYQEKLVELCKECGLYETDVTMRRNGNVVSGRLQVERTCYHGSTHNISFHRYTKSGTLATNSACRLWNYDYESDEEIKKKLLRTFSPLQREVSLEMDAPEKEQ